MSWLDRVISLTLPAVPKPVVRYFSRRYIAGPAVEDALRVIRDLERQGAAATVDILGEFITTRDEARANLAAHERLIERLRRENLGDVYLSVKLTALGLSLDREACLENVRRVVERAAAAEMFVRLDMEDSGCTTATLEIHDALRREYPGRVGCVLQSMLRRTLEDVDRLTEEALDVRLCKGIYQEPREIAYVDPELIRRNYVEALDLLLARGARVGIATHDEILVWEALRLIRHHGVAPERYEFQMLLGVDEQLRRILIDAGHRLRVYVPFGEHWYGYSVRRLRENPKIAGYAFKAIFQRG